MNLNHQTPGTKYTESGKLDFLRLLLFLVIGYILSALIGIGYGLLSDLNPFIYLNFILLGISAFAVIFAAGLFRVSGKLRNRYLLVILVVFFGFVCIYNAWSAIYAGPDQSVFGGLYFQRSFSEIIQLVSLRELNIGKFGRDGDDLGTQITSIIYIIEFLILTVAPAIFLGKNPSYYCEDCDKPMTDKELYFGLTAEQSEAIQSEVKSGKLKGLFELTAYENKKLSLSLKYIHCSSHECPDCNKLVYSADFGIAKVEKENVSFKKQESLAVNLFGSRTA